MVNEMTGVLELENLPLKHISHTQIKMYERCPHQYYLRYIKGIKVPVKPSFILGRAVHTTEEYNFKEKLANDRFPEVDLLQDLYAGMCEEISKTENVDWGVEKDTSIDKIKDQGTKLVKIYQPHAIRIQPLAVEEKVRVQFPGTDWTLIGQRDLRTTDKRIIDFKTSGQAFNRDGYEWEDQQLIIYQLDIEDRQDYSLEIHGMIKTARPKIQILKFRPHTPAQISEYIEDLVRVTLLIRTGLFPKRKDWKNCSWCGYRHYGICK